MPALVTDSGRKSPARLASSAILACQTDDRLVKLVRSGHERAFEAIVQRYRNSLVRYCRRMLPESRCEDAVQQAFINAHAALLGSEDAVQLKPWLFAITRNAALNMLRQNGWHYEQIPADFDGVPRPDQIFEERAQLEQTVAAMNDLPERQRDALVMREFEGRSYDEIALALGANDGAVRQLLNRARVALRSAAAAVIPPPLVMRAAASLPPGDGRGAAEILGGLGAAGVAKASATALVAGTLVVGIVEAPLPISHKTSREPATLSPAAKKNASVARSSHSTPVALHSTSARSHHGTGASQSSGQLTHGGGPSRSGHSGPSHSGRSDDGGSGETGHSGSGERERSGSGHDRSDRDDAPRHETERSGDRSGTSGGGSDNDEVAAVVESDEVGGGSESADSGSTGSRSGSGSGDSGSGSTVTSPSAGSGLSDSTSDGSGSSGSGSSGSGSADSEDLVDH
jgi:RNA polymerase sigma factor (sigma-70 family)